MIKKTLLLFFIFVPIVSLQAQTEEVELSDADKTADLAEITADPDATEETKKDYPKQGVLSSNGSIGFGSIAVKQPWQGPVKGSISKVGKDWEVKLSNNDESDKYQMSLSLEQFAKSGNKVRIAKTNPMSARLAPGDSKTQTFRGANNTIGARLLVRHWKVVQ